MRNTLNRKTKAWLYANATRLVPLLATVLVSPALLMSADTADASTVTAAKSSARGGVFGGNTSQGEPVVIKVSRNGRKVKRATTTLDLHCASGMELSLPEEYRAVRIRSRSFHDSYRLSDDDTGLHFEFAGSVRGKLNRKRTKITGRWTLSAVVTDANGRQVDDCRSGRVRFSATR